jgi:hypothetical protein
MPKPNTHPTWFENTPLLCDGKPVMFNWVNKT